MANGKTKVIDKGFKRIRRDLHKTDGSTVDVGILKGVSGSDLATGTNFTVAEIAAVQEFGSRDGRIPERSFIRSVVDSNKVKYRSVLKSLIGDVLLGNLSVEKALAQFGERVVGDIKRKITSISSPPNAPSTIAGKGFNNPLIRTGTMRSRIKSKVKL